MEYINLNYSDVLIAITLMLIPLVISFQSRLGIEKDILIGTVRTFVQLMIIGYILKYIFNVRAIYLIFIIIFTMSLIAGYNGVKRQKVKIPNLFIYLTSSILLGAAVAVSALIFVVLKVDPWWEPQYLIPVSGMMLANAMNASALGVDRLYSEVKNRRWQIEAALALGATPKKAVHPALREAARAAMMPTINSLMIVGIVQLPGMMTGQILSGTAPEQSIRYQIVIMYMLATSVTISCISTLYLTSKHIFNDDEQLVL